MNTYQWVFFVGFDVWPEVDHVLVGALTRYY